MSTNGTRDLKAQFEGKYARAEPTITQSTPKDSCGSESCNDGVSE